MHTTFSPEVVEWFKEQDAYTRLVLSRIPGGVAMLARIKQLDQSGPPRVFDVQRYQDEKYFYQKSFPMRMSRNFMNESGCRGRKDFFSTPIRT